MQLKINKKELLKRISFYLIGLLIACLGIAMIIYSKIGAGPWDAVFVGLNTKFGLTIGTWAIITQIILVFIAALIGKKRPEYECIITILLRGWFLDFWFYIGLKNLNLSTTITMQWTNFILGTILLGLGIGTYVVSKYPKTPVDGLMITLQETFNWSLRVSRTVVEIAAVIIAFLLQGPVGWGTLILAVLLGQIVQTTNNNMKKIYNKI